MKKLMSIPKYSAAFACIGLMVFIAGINGNSIITICLGAIGFTGCTMKTIENFTEE
jgi:hypothetical protein